MAIPINRVYQKSVLHKGPNMNGVVDRDEGRKGGRGHALCLESEQLVNERLVVSCGPRLVRLGVLYLLALSRDGCQQRFCVRHGKW